MKVFIYLILIALSWSNLVSQEYFIKRLDINDESSNSDQIFQYDERYYSTFGHFCGELECSTLVELDDRGNILWSIENKDIDLGPETSIISNDTITLISNNDPINTHFRMAHFDLDGNKLGETMEIKHPSDSYTNVYCLTTQKRNGKFHIMGPSIQDGNAFSLMFVVDAKGALDTLIRIDSTENRCTVYDSDIDDEGNLITFLKMEEPFGTKTYMKIIKFDGNLDSVWTFSSDDHISHLRSIKGTTNNKIIFFTIYTENANNAKHSIKTVDENKNTKILYSPEKISTNRRAFGSLHRLSNGDILGIGSFQDIRLDPVVTTAPWIIRFNQEGEILWQRVFYELDTETNSARIGTVRDVIELTNGDLYGIGDLRYEFPTSFIFIIDADGCLDPDDCDLVQFITGTDDFYPQEDIEIYPNPSSDYVTIALSDNRDDHEYIIIDHYGRNVISSTRLVNNEEIDISMLTIGVYYVLIVKEGKIVGSEKMVKK